MSDEQDYQTSPKFKAWFEDAMKNAIREDKIMALPWHDRWAIRCMTWLDERHWLPASMGGDPSHYPRPKP